MKNGWRPVTYPRVIGCRIYELPFQSRVAFYASHNDNALIPRHLTASGVSGIILERSLQSMVRWSGRFNFIAERGVIVFRFSSQRRPHSSFRFTSHRDDWVAFDGQLDYFSLKTQSKKEISTGSTFQGMHASGRFHHRPTMSRPGGRLPVHQVPRDAAAGAGMCFRWPLIAFRCKVEPS